MASESKNVLIIDDDVKLGQLLNDYLARFAFHVFHAPSPSLGLALLEKVSPDIIILDVMLPEMDGFEVCRQIRKRSQIPIIMLTARGDTTDRIVGLELGAPTIIFPNPLSHVSLLPACSLYCVGRLEQERGFLQKMEF